MASAKDIIQMAESFLGTKEFPQNSNNVIFNTHYYGREVSGSSYPWCCAFVWDVFRLCNAAGLFYGGNKTAYCPTAENYYKKQSRYYGKTEGQAGDLCFMDFSKGRASHIGIVKCRQADGSYLLIEGNTSTSSDDNGGIVMERTRGTNVIRGFGRPTYKASPAAPIKPEAAEKPKAPVQPASPVPPAASARSIFVKEIQKATGAKPDGIPGPETLSKTITVSQTKNRKHAVVAILQAYLNSLGYAMGAVDGIAGPKFDQGVRSYQKNVVGLKNPDGELTAQKNTWKCILGMKR